MDYMIKLTKGDYKGDHAGWVDDARHRVSLLSLTADAPIESVRAELHRLLDRAIDQINQR